MEKFNIIVGYSKILQRTFKGTWFYKPAVVTCSKCLFIFYFVIKPVFSNTGDNSRCSLLQVVALILLIAT